MDGHSLSVSKSGSKNGTFTTIITENNAAWVSASNLKFHSVWPEFYVMKPVHKLHRFRSSDSDKINAGKTTLQVFERAPITLIFLLHSHEHQKSINRPRRLIFNDNHSIHHKYMHMKIDISDTPPGIPQLKVNPREIYIHLLRKKRTSQRDTWST